MTINIFIKLSIILTLSLNIFANDEVVEYINTGNSIADYTDYQRRLGNITEEEAANPLQGMRLQKTNIFSVDTRDQETCHNIARDLESNQIISQAQLKSFCSIDEENPIVSVIGSPQKVSDAFTLKYSNLSKSEKEMARQSRNFLVPGIALMAIFYAMPSEHTGWDNFSASEAIAEYNDNVAAGPIIEDNPWAYNWIGHPYTGATYYTLARHAGFNRASAFGYSFFMSTFYWEYGIEAIAEIPSTQDLIITPVIGALLGEAFLYAEKRIQGNGGKVMGSNRLGNVAMAIMNPADGMFRLIDNAFDNFDTEETEGYMKILPPTGKSSSKPSIEFGINILF